MIRRKRMISLLLILALSLGTVMQANATEIDDTKKKAEELKKKKKDAENEKASLAEQLENVVAEMEDTKDKIEEKENEISTKEEELIQAKVDENDQYESMKKRIRYMYESGNSQFIEILCESKNISDFLNKAEYISTISSYDREMLVEFQEIVQQVEEQETALKEEYDDLKTMQEDLIEKQESVTNLIASKEEEIGEIESDLGDTQDKLAELEEAAAEALRKQKEQQQASSGSSGSAGGSVISGNGTFTHPCPGYSYISSTFGYREQPLPGASTNHKGIDYAAATGTPIYAAAGGTVVSAGYSGNAGNMIVINHGNGLTTYYMHCNSIFVSAGQTVSKGQNIATVGTTGNSTGPHLHFQVNLNGVPVNPANYL